MDILVTDGNSRAALAITRSLGSKGHRIYAACHSPRSLASHSRYCHKSLTYPDPAQDRSGFLQAILQAVNRHRIDVLMPVTDVCVLPIATNIERFESACRVPLPSIGTLTQAADKAGLIATAKRLGVAVPRSVIIDSFERSCAPTAEFGFPVVIKPSRSRVEAANGWVSTSVGYALSREDLQSKLGALPAAAYPVLLQERIAGPGIGLFYCFDRGNPVAAFAHKRLREKPPSGGISVLRESIELHRRAHEFGLALLRELEWHGVAMVEFKIDERDQEPKLMEINGRFWGSLQLAIDSGVDFPDLLLRLALGEKVQYSEAYDIGTRSRWFWGEIDLLLIYLFKSSKSLNLPPDHEHRLLAALKILSPYVRRQHFEVLRLSDLKPWIYETIEWFRS